MSAAEQGIARACKNHIHNVSTFFELGSALETARLTEDEIKAAFMSAANKALFGKDPAIKNFRRGGEEVFDTTALEREQDKLTDELNAAAGLIQDGIRRNAGVALDQADDRKEYETPAERKRRVRPQNCPCRAIRSVKRTKI